MDASGLDYLRDIITEAEKKYPKDFIMQEHEIKTQLDACRNIQKLKNTEAD